MDSPSPSPTHSPVFDDVGTPSHHVGLILGVIAVVLMAGIGGTVYAAKQGWIQLPFGLFTSASPTLAQIGQALAGVESGTLTTSLKLQLSAREDGTLILPPFPKEEEDVMETSEEGEGSEAVDAIANDILLGSAPSLMSYLASDTTITAEMTTQFQADENPDGEGRFKASYQSSGLALNFDLAYRRVGSDAYVQLNSFPLPIMDFPAITGTWVHIPGQDSDTFNLLSGGASSDQKVWEYIREDDEEESPTLLEREEQVSEELRVLRDAVFTHGAIVVRSAEQVTDESGARVWRLGLSLDPVGTRDALQAAVRNRLDVEKPTVLTDDLQAMTEREGFLEWLTAVSDALQSTVDVDPKTALPLRQTFTMVFALAGEEDFPSPRQYRLDVSYALQDVNAPVSVNAPADAIETREAAKRLFHQTDEDVLFQDQVSILKSLRDALDAYQEQQGRYPVTLLELIGVTNESFVTRRVVNIPNDPYTGQPFVYTLSEDGQDYTLLYQIQIPESSSFSSKRYVNGTNTATKDVDSVEASEKVDTDDDGLTDTEEARLGTSSLRKDSDNDGYTDKEEVDAGFNPLENAKTKKIYGPY